MVDFTKFSSAERGFLASIPYRVGVWISKVDDNTGSQIDDREERKALEAMINNFAAKGGKLAFAAGVMSDVKNSKAAWSKWEGIATEEKLLEDIPKALSLCKAKELTDSDINQYKQTIWRMGLAIAQAYGEHVDPDNEMHVDKFFKWVGSLGGGAKLGDNPENMSKSEKAALNKLRAVLKE